MKAVLVSTVLALVHADSCPSDVVDESALLQAQIRKESVDVDGFYDENFDWSTLAHKKPDPSEVCIGEHEQCYPVKDNGFMGTPCGVLSMGDPQGCFMNSPTQTCALCTTEQPYCVPTSQVPRCKKQQKNEPVMQAIGGGVDHGSYQNDFDWAALAHQKPDSSEVCIGEHDQCYPIKGDSYLGSPCGVLSMGNPQGCFMNSPTQTCALCTTEQPYCVPTSKIRRCKMQKKPQQVSPVAGGFDWTALVHQKPNPSVVCIGEHEQCYPVKDNGFMGTPCGVLSMGDPQGCFMNSPTQTCALCTTEQPYCVPTSKVPRCEKQKEDEPVTQAVGGGVDHGSYQNDFDWAALAHNKPDSSEVCIGEHDQCYPIKGDGYLGSPCGVLSMGNPQGCFMNSPTQTCALCTTEQPYCVPTSKIRRCMKQ